MMATVMIDGLCPENIDPRSNIPEDEIELIEVYRLPIDNLMAELDKFAKDGVLIMSELYNFALGLEWGKKQ